MALACLAFVSLGLPDAAGAVAWPGVKTAFSLPQSGLGFVLLCGGCGYFASSFLAGKMVTAWGVGLVLIVSTALAALGVCGYAASPAWPLFLACSLIVGLGSGAIDAGLNHYAAHHFTAGQMNWLHAAFGIGATLGPLLMTAAIAGAASWRLGYSVIGLLLWGMTLMFALTHKRWESPTPGEEQQVAAGAPPGIALVLRNPVVQLQLVLFFVYTGLEVMVGQWSYTLLTQSRGVSPDLAGIWTGVYWGCLVLGRVLSGFVVRRMGADLLVRLCTAGALLGAILYTVSAPSSVGFLSIALMGLALAPIFPCLMSRTPQRVGLANAAHAVGFQVSAAMLGAAILPSLGGLAVAWFDLEAVTYGAAFLAALLCVVHEVVYRITRA